VEVIQALTTFSKSKLFSFGMSLLQQTPALVNRLADGLAHSDCGVRYETLLLFL